MTQPPGLDGQPSLALATGRRCCSRPQDHPWLKPDECFVVSDVSFEHLAADSNWRQLVEHLGADSRVCATPAWITAPSERMAIHSRIVQPVLDMTLLFLGLPLVLSRSNRNVFLAIGMCLALVVAFMLVVIGCQYLGVQLLARAVAGRLAAADDLRALRGGACRSRCGE